VRHWKQTFSGKQVDFINPDPEQLCIEDIAHALAHTCRYTGHTQYFYSTAEHSIILVNYIWSNLGYSKQDQFTMLMHDAAEAFLGDISSPLKALLPDYKKIEKNFEKVLANKFGFEYPLPDRLKQLDKRIILDEVKYLFAESVGNWEHDDYEPLNVEIAGLSPDQAKRKFLYMFHNLKHLRR
jgi:uncharacterized protein